MSAFSDLRARGLPIDWTTIYVGWTGFHHVPRLVTNEEIVSYAGDKLASDEDSGADTLCVLAGASPADTDLIHRCLKELTKREAGDTNIAIRKWRVSLLRSVLADLSKDPLYALLGLTEFWAQFDYPKGMPHRVQGLNNSTAPQDYYTEATLGQERRAHVEWLAKEERELSPSPKKEPDPPQIR